MERFLLFGGQSCTYRRAVWTSNILTSLWPDYVDPALNSLLRRKNNLGHIYLFYDLCYRNIFIPMMTAMKWSYEILCLELFLYLIDDCAVWSNPCKYPQRGPFHRLLQGWQGASLSTASRKWISGLSFSTIAYNVFKCRTVRHPVSPVPEWIKMTMPGAARYRNKSIQSNPVPKCSGSGLRWRNADASGIKLDADAQLGQNSHPFCTSVQSRSLWATFHSLSLRIHFSHSWKEIFYQSADSDASC